MKKLIIFFLILTLQIFSQESAYTVEIFFGTANMGQNDPVPTFSFSAKSFVWGVDYPPPANCNNWVFELTGDFNSRSYTPSANNQPESAWKGFDFVTSQNTADVEDFAYGLYKFSISNGKHFYLDYRDERIGCDSYGTVGHQIDVWIKYNKNGEQLEYKHGGTTTYQPINNGSYLSLWDMKSAGTPHTDDLEYYWTHALAVIPSAVTNAHPVLKWGPYPDAGSLSGTITEYKIYKSAAHIPGNEPSNFSYLGSVQPDTYSYTDLNEDMGNGNNAKSYYIKALVEDDYDRTFETDPTNTVEVQLAPPSKIVPTISVENGYSLLQNYPNPFNPTTNIFYSLAKDDYVYLRVFNLLGEQVATLVHGYQNAGMHSAEFNSSELPGGIYIYKIECSGFTDAKKMILMK